MRRLALASVLSLGCAAPPVDLPEAVDPSAGAFVGGYGYILRNTSLGGCDDPYYLAASDGESGQRALARLTNDAAHDVWVEGVLFDQGFVGDPYDVQVELWTQPGTWPDASPPIARSHVMKAIFTGPGYETHTWSLLMPLEVPAGHSLYVSIEMREDDGNERFNNLARCMDDTTPSANFWGSATAAPYPWDELGPTFRLWGDLFVQAIAETNPQELVARTAFDVGQATSQDAWSPLWSASTAGPPEWLHAPECATTRHYHAVRWTAPTGGNYRFDTAASDAADTVLAVLDEHGFQELACADDGVGNSARAFVERAVDQGEVLTLLVGVRAPAQDGDVALAIWQP
jgi:hypothetical protein